MIIGRIINRIKKQFFVKKFRSFSTHSGMGSNGVGKGCLLSGADHMSIGDDCYFGEGSQLIALENHFSQELTSELNIGNHVRCVGGCRITCAGNIKICDNVLLGPDVFITDHNHGMDPTCSDGYSKQPLIIKDVLIKEGVWLGQRVAVMPGVTIGEHSIVGAHSVVTHDIPSYSMAVGAPARVIKKWNSNSCEWTKA